MADSAAKQGLFFCIFPTFDYLCITILIHPLSLVRPRCEALPVLFDTISFFFHTFVLIETQSKLL